MPFLRIMPKTSKASSSAPSTVLTPPVSDGVASASPHGLPLESLSLSLMTVSYLTNSYVLSNWKIARAPL